MTASNFAFLQTGWPELLAEARRAEMACHVDPRTACFYARRTLELAVAWLYRAEGGQGGALRLPYKADLSAYLFEPSFKLLVGPALHAKMCTSRACPAQCAMRDEDEDAKRFDLLMLRLQLGVLNTEPGFERLAQQVRDIATRLLELSNIPDVRRQTVLIEAVAGEEWWVDVTLPMLEQVRRHLRGLVRLIDKTGRKVIYTDFEDALGEATEVELPLGGSAGDFERFRTKVRAFLRAHDDHLALHKLRRNLPLTQADLAELDRMLAESGTGTAQDFQRAAAESQGLGLFVRSQVGLDRQTATEALSGFLQDKTLSSNQLEFLNLVVNHLTERGAAVRTTLHGLRAPRP